jgi:DNA-binding response OmpR family regulator
MATTIDRNTHDRTVLLIDGEIDAAEPLQRLLEMDGYRVHWCQDGEAGLNEALLIHPDIIIVNLSLPGLDGFDIARVLRTLPEFRYKPLIGLCSFADTAWHQQALDAGFNRYFCRPVALEALESYLRSFR